jgi:hypothetical protein
MPSQSRLVRHLALLLLCTPLAFAGGGRNRVVGDEIPIPPVKAPITVDGDLSEWDEAKAKLLTLKVGGGENDRSPVPLTAYSAQIAFRYDKNNLYAALWWKDPTPLGPEKSANATPPGDGLVLSIPTKDSVTRMAFWRDPAGTALHAIVAKGDTPFGQGTAMKGSAQAYKVTGANSYSQELQIPWSEIGVSPEAGVVNRIGVELCFGGLDPAAGYKAWKSDNAAGIYGGGNRSGGMMQWGFMDGIKSLDQAAPTYDPATGAKVTLMPAGATVQAISAVMYNGKEETRTTAMIAVPAQKIVIDGKMEPGEWDAKSATRIASEPTLFPNRYAVDVHWAYDDKGLYAGLRWLTGGPHLNINDPAKIDRGYDGGDALQIRLGTDRVSHIDTWYHDETRKPAMNITYGARFNDGGNLPDALAKGAAMAINPLTGGGYTQEVFLPWSLITTDGKPLQQGAAFQAILDVFFSGLEGNRIPYIVNARVEQPSGVITLPFTAPADGFYTVVIVDKATGQTIRRLANIEKMSKGQSVVEWDGLDDNGLPAKPAQYEYKGLRHDGIGLKYLMTLNNPGAPTWQTDDGRGEWGADHCAPQTVATDASGVYLGWPSAEDGNGIIGCDPEGKKRWGFFGTPMSTGAGGTALLAVDGDNLYFAAQGMLDVRSNPKGSTALAFFKAVITCLDKNTGFRSGFSTAKPYHEIAENTSDQVKVSREWDVRQTKSASLDTIGLRDDYFYSGHCAGVNLAGLAARDGKIYVSLRIPGEVVVYSAKDMAELARWKIDKPAGLAFSTDGKLFGISGQTVVRIDPASGKATPVVTAGLEAPVGLAVGKDGDLYVSDWAGAQRVKVFDGKGKQVRTIGKPGGRASTGTYDPNGMLKPRGIALDKDGRLWVTEDENSPRRISLWDAKSGKFLREWIGGSVYGGTEGGLIDPSNPTRAFSDGAWFGIDLSKEGYQPLLTLHRRSSDEDFFAPIPQTARGNNIHRHRIFEANGRRYLSVAAGAKVGAILVGELLPDYSWCPSVAIGNVHPGAKTPLVGWRWGPSLPFFAKHAGENYIWTDANADGIPQEEEFQWRKPEGNAFPNFGAHWGMGMFDKDMNAYLGGSGMVFRFPLQGWTANGIPKFDINNAKMVARQDGKIDSVAVDSRQWVFTLLHAERAKKGEIANLSGFDPEGKLRWSIPTSTDYRQPNTITGEGLMGPVNAGGELGEIMGATIWHGLQVPLVTTDGLLFAKLLRDPAQGGEPGPDMSKGECIQTLNGLDDGRVILAHGKNAHHFLQVTGLETVKRFSGGFELTAAQAQLAATRAGKQKAKAAESEPIRIAITTEPPSVDGNLEEWDWKTASAIGPKEGTPRAEVALRTSGKNLYAAFKVFKNGAYLNTEKDDPSMIFVKGDAVELRFRSAPGANPKDKNPLMGDSRLVIAKVDGKPVAVLYRALVPNAKNPVVFRNPAGTQVVFDAVEVLKAAAVQIVDTPDGYLVEAALPLDFLGGNLWPNRVIPGDAGIIVADSTGRRVARICRFNKDTQLVSDVPTEARLQPENWGEIQVVPGPAEKKPSAKK